MRTSNFAHALLSSLLLAVLCSNDQAFARGVPPAPATQDNVNGLGGTVNIAAATSTVIDRSYAMAGFAGANFKFQAGSNQTLGDYLTKVAEILPDTVGGFAEQYRSYHNGPVYNAPELAIGNYPSGLDVSYERYDGGLSGDGVGLRYSNATRNGYAARRKSQTYRDVMELRKAWLALAAGIGKHSLPSHNILIDDFTNLQKYMGTFSAGKTGVVGDKPDIDALINEYNSLVNKLQTFSDLKSEIARSYAEATVRPAFAVIAGHTNISGIADLNIGLSASCLHLLSDGSGIGGLFSLQQEFISTALRKDTSVTQGAISIAWQDKVATASLPDNRWVHLVGAELVFPTLYDRSATYDLFYRIRPYYRGKSVGYVPYDLTGFVGIGPTGYLYGGFKVGIGFGL